MTPLLRRCLPFLLALAALLPPGAHAQPASGSAPASQQQLDSLLAPIALYPDQLLAQVLMAATYPLDVVGAARFVKENKGLKGDALDKALEGKNWDPSVQSLAAFPQVLDMMNDKLEWTQSLGDAYLADQSRVMATVQALREKARANGNLKDSEQQKVVVQEKTIIIEPARTEVVYVPAYNPTTVYGTWWWPAYPPFFWYPPPYYGYAPYYPGAGLAIGFGIGLAVGANHWGWCNTNWGGNTININNNHNNNFVNNRPQYKNNVANGKWQHDAAQRKGVAYRDSGTRDKFQGADRSGVSARQDYRGRDGSGSAGTRDVQRPGGGDRQGMSRESPQGGGGRGGADRAGSVSASQPIARTGGSGGYGGSAGSGARASPSMNTHMSRPQAQQASNRGASSRQSASPSRSGGGGGGRGGGGGGGGRGGGGRR